jgi:hypothetical protein
MNIKLSDAIAYDNGCSSEAFGKIVMIINKIYPESAKLPLTVHGQNSIRRAVSLIESVMTGKIIIIKDEDD